MSAIAEVESQLPEHRHRDVAGIEVRTESGAAGAVQAQVHTPILFDRRAGQPQRLAIEVVGEPDHAGQPLQWRTRLLHQPALATARGVEPGAAVLPVAGVVRAPRTAVRPHRQGALHAPLSGAEAGGTAVAQMQACRVVRHVGAIECQIHAAPGFRNHVGVRKRVAEARAAHAPHGLDMDAVRVDLADAAEPDQTIGFAGWRIGEPQHAGLAFVEAFDQHAFAGTRGIEPAAADAGRSGVGVTGGGGVALAHRRREFADRQRWRKPAGSVPTFGDGGDTGGRQASGIARRLWCRHPGSQLLPTGDQFRGAETAMAGRGFVDRHRQGVAAVALPDLLLVREPHQFITIGMQGDDACVGTDAAIQRRRAREIECGQRIGIDARDTRVDQGITVVDAATAERVAHAELVGRTHQVAERERGIGQVVEQEVFAGEVAEAHQSLHAFALWRRAQPVRQGDAGALVNPRIGLLH